MFLSAVGRRHIGGVSKCTPSFLCTDKSARVGGYSPLAASHPPSMHFVNKSYITMP